MSEWISVKERTPEVGQIVVGWLSKRKEPSCVRFEIDDIGPIYWELVQFDIFDDRQDLVSHWMPLPSPPNQ